MGYFKEVKEEIDFLTTGYKINNKLDYFDILHLYPENKPAYPNGFTDARFFELIGFNSITRERKNLGRHDGIRVINSCVDLYHLMVYADGSFFAKFTKLVFIDYNTQLVYIREE